MFHLVTSRASEFTDHSRSGLANRAQYSAFKTILEAQLARIPLLRKSSGGSRWSSRQGVATAVNVDLDLLASSRYLSTHDSAAPFIR